MTSEPFDHDGMPVAGGGTTSARVTMRESGLAAWAKPARASAQDEYCAAHEKIAADLAHRVGAPVPPVALARPAEGGPWAPLVALSYEALPQGRVWGQMATRITAEIMAAIRPTLSAMWAFHAWLNDGDHCWNNGNVIIELHAKEAPRLAFIDYSFSLLKNWKPPAAPDPQQIWHIPAAHYAPCDHAAMAEMVQKIEKLSSTDLGMIIKRIPEDALGARVGELLFEGLDSRRHELSGILNLEGKRP